MQKNRPAIRLTVLCDPDRRQALAELIFRESTTFGLRIRTGERYCLKRRMDQVQTPWGPVAVKLALWGDQILRASPEFEECRALALREQVALQKVYAEANAAIHARFEITAAPIGKGFDS
jgi:hypothetical protein